MAGRRYHHPTGVCLVPAECARIVAVLLSEAVEQRARRDGVTFPRQLVDWLADDLQAFAAAQPAGHQVPAAELAEEWWTTAEAARQWGLSPARVRQLCETGAVVAEKPAGRWRVAPERKRSPQTQVRQAG